jgi:DNA-binding NarL/FixJ family response regulator
MSAPGTSLQPVSLLMCSHTLETETNDHTFVEDDGDDNHDVVVVDNDNHKNKDSLDDDQIYFHDIPRQENRLRSSIYAIDPCSRCIQDHICCPKNGRPTSSSHNTFIVSRATSTKQRAKSLTEILINFLFLSTLLNYLCFLNVVATQNQMYNEPTTNPNTFADAMTFITTVNLDWVSLSSTLPLAFGFVHNRRRQHWYRNNNLSYPSLVPSILVAATRASNDGNERDGEKVKEKEASNPRDNKVDQRSKHWIIVVDDEEDLRLAVGDYLYDKGYHVTACSDAPALLEICNMILLEQQSSARYNTKQQEQLKLENADDDRQTTSRLPDAIVSDVRMPGGPNGVELVKAIRSHPSDEFRTTPIVLLTAKAMTQDRIEGYKAGADVYLPKPFAPDELVSIVDNLIARREQRERAVAFAAATARVLNNDNKTNGRESRSTAHIPDLLALKQELEEIKGIMKQNAARVVQKTDVYLTDTERQVLELVCDGYTNAEIAAQRGVGIITINRMITKLFDETQTRTRTELVKWAVSTGYVSG